MSNKICPNCLQEWPQCICVTPIKRPGAEEEVGRPRPHPILSVQLMAPTVVRLGGTPAADPPKEFCPDCHQPWQSCGCSGRRIKL